MSDRDDSVLSGMKDLVKRFDKTDQKLDETKESVSALDKKVDLFIQETQRELKSINKLDAQQNELIDQHIEGVRTLKEMHKDLRYDIDNRFKPFEEANISERLDNIEKPRKTIKTILSFTKKAAGWIGAIGGAVYLIMRIFGIVP